MQHPNQSPYPLTSQRPSLSETRPHTVHASTPGSFVTDGDGHEDYSDDQITPRASLVEHARDRLSRDDTAADLVTLAHGNAKLDGSQGPVDLWQQQQQQQDYASQYGLQRRSTKRGFRFTGNSSHPPMDFELPLGQGRHSTQSLGRRFSRNYKQTMQELRESMTKHATLPGRMRRSSTPHGIESSSERYVNPALLHPTSPSKRTAAKPADLRAKKSRLFALSGTLTGSNSGQENRKDTPAPPGFNAPRMMPQPFGHAESSGSSWHLHGGEGARAAAVAYNNPSQFTQDALWNYQNEFDEEQHQHEQRVRRATICSNGDAADSGADLTVPAPKEDSVADVDDMEVDQNLDGILERPARLDLAKVLPSELVLGILEYLDAQDLIQATKVSRAWRDYANEMSPWREAFLRQYDRKVYTDPAPVQVGGIGVGRLGIASPLKQEWKKLYKARVELEQNWRKGAQRAGKAIYLSGHTDSVYCVQFDEEKIITGSRDRTIRVWDINTFQCLRVIGGPTVRPVLGPKVLRTVDYPAFHLATASVNGTAYGDNIYHVPSEWHDASILCLQYDEEILVTGSSDSDLLIWDIKTYEPIKRLRKHTGGVLDVALDAKHIVSCSKDSKIIVWNRENFEPIGELTGHRGPVNAVQLRGKYLVSASGDGIARLWDLEDMKLVKQFEAKERGLAAVEFSEDMKYVLAGGNDHITYKFDVETGKEVMQFTGHTQLVRSLWLDSANNRVVSGSYDLDLRVYDFVTGQEIWRAEEWTTSWMLAAKSDYRRIVATSQDGRILVVDFGLNKSRGPEDGQPIDNVDLLRGVEHTNAIQWRNPWAS